MSPSDFDQRAQERVGTTLNGKYRLDSVLGVGGMAVVYAATHRNQKRFAVKMLHRELSLESDVRARFLREGYAANTVNHPGAVAVLDDDVAEDGAAFLVMELLEGDSVDGVCTRWGEKLPLAAVLGIAHQALDVLEAGHRHAIIHRDIKPANLFLVHDGRLKVLDFGIARLRDTTASHLATRTGAMLGTPAFMAPEQALGEGSEVGPRTDVWAVGATIFTLLTGELVHDSKNPSQLLVRAATVPARSLSTVAPDMPEVVVRLVDRALAFDREARWPSAAAMRDAVAKAHHDLFGEPPRPEALLALFETASPRQQGAPSAGVAKPSATMTAAPPTGPRRAPAPPAGTTTAKPVSGTGSRHATSSRRGPWGWVATAGVLAAAVGTAAVHFLPAPRVASGDQPAPSASLARAHEDPPVGPSAQTSASTPPVVEPPVASSSPAPASTPPPRSRPDRPPNTAPVRPAQSPALSATPTASPDRNPLRMPLQ